MFNNKKSENKSTTPQKFDKILNNTFNQGEQTYEDFGDTMKVHDSVSSLYEDQLGDNIIEIRTLKMLDEELYAIFEKSPYYEKYKKPKRADGSDRLQMYYYFKEKLLLSKKYSNAEIFIAFAEFFQVNYDQLYNEIGVLDKESLLKELSLKHGLSEKIKTKKLF
jgi:hypothetical protein